MATALPAGEVTIEERPFIIEAAFTASVMPEGGVLPLELDVRTWEDFHLVEITAHGARVPKGGLLARFDTDGIDRKLEDTRRAIASGTLGAARAEQELKILQETAPHRLDAARRAAEIAREENTYFTKTRRKAMEENATQQLEIKKQMLSNQQEELRQLTKMYQADDLTEETEEIILTRQKDDVATAEFALRMETLDQKRALEVTLPREAVTLANNERDTAIALRAAEEEIPRSIELKKLELAALTASLQRDKETLADLEHDRTRFEFKAPADGWFYHGPIENGRWTPGEAIKNLVKNGSPPVRRPFATFIPAAAKLALVAFPDEAKARALETGLTGTASLTGREDIEIPVKLTRLATVPETNGTYRVDFSVTWPKDLTPPVGATAQIRLVSYQQPAAIFIPTKALAHDARGWTVEIMLADGKTERRPVKRGRLYNDDTEILSGLEIGQVIIAP
jgi:HlyD family secretion protein